MQKLIGVLEVKEIDFDAKVLNCSPHCVYS